MVVAEGVVVVGAGVVLLGVVVVVVGVVAAVAAAVTAVAVGVVVVVVEAVAVAVQVKGGRRTSACIEQRRELWPIYHTWHTWIPMIDNHRAAVDLSLFFYHSPLHGLCYN